jgi:hypothetical protein
MRKNLIFFSILATLLTTCFSAIIITSSLPKVFRINDKQTIISFDEEPTSEMTPQDAAAISIALSSAT